MLFRTEYISSTCTCTDHDKTCHQQVETKKGEKRGLKVAGVAELQFRKVVCVRLHHFCLHIDEGTIHSVSE